jgi:hypothetical protein
MILFFHIKGTFYALRYSLDGDSVDFTRFGGSLNL